MRLNSLIMGAALLVVAAAAATPELESRAFSGAGSVGTDGTIEFYLPEGIYHHRLFGRPDCLTTVSVVPARGEPTVDASHVLAAGGGQSASGLDPEPALSFTVTSGWWAHLRVDTIPGCLWAYSITGPFVAAGTEPLSPTERDQRWLIISGALVAAVLALSAWRRKGTAAPIDDDAAISVLDG